MVLTRQIGVFFCSRSSPHCFYYCSPKLLFPFRVRPDMRLPAISLLPGATPAHAFLWTYRPYNNYKITSIFIDPLRLIKWKAVATITMESTPCFYQGATICGALGCCSQSPQRAQGTTTCFRQSSNKYSTLEYFHLSKESFWVVWEVSLEKESLL
jgi:hypothetical protein